MDKKQDFIRVRTAVTNAENELKEILKKKGLLYSPKSEIRIDFKDDNILFLDFNPKTNKVLLAFIDFDELGSIRTWEP